MRPEYACKSTAEDVTQHTTEVLRYRAHFSGLCRDEQPRKTSWSPKPCSAGRVCRFEFTDEFKTWLSTITPSGSVRSWSHIFCGASAHIGLFELPRASVSGHHSRTGAALDVGATLTGSSDENLGPTTGMCARPLTALGYVSLGKATPLHFHKSFTFF